MQCLKKDETKFWLKSKYSDLIFQWSKADFADDTPHVGMPDLWNFEPVTHDWQMS